MMKDKKCDSNGDNLIDHEIVEDSTPVNLNPLRSSYRVTGYSSGSGEYQQCSECLCDPTFLKSTHEYDLPEDLWKLGLDRSELVDPEQYYWFEHLYTKDNAIKVLKECLTRRIQIALWNIVHWQNPEDNWLKARHGILLDLIHPSRWVDGFSKGIFEMPCMEAVEFSLNTGIEKLEGLDPTGVDPTSNRFELTMYRATEKSWPPKR